MKSSFFIFFQPEVPSQEYSFGTVNQILSVSSNQLSEPDVEQGVSTLRTDIMKSELAPSLTQTVDEVYRNTSVKSVVELSSSPVSKEENAKVVFLLHILSRVKVF